MNQAGSHPTPLHRNGVGGTATAVVSCAEVNAVRVDQLHPRALLTPFTDDVDLTPGDRRAYAAQAEAQRSKGFENVEVSFDAPPNDVDAPSDSTISS